MLKLILISALACTILSACENNKPKAIPEDDGVGKIPVSAINNPRTSENTNAENLGKLVFTDTLHDFGTIKEGEVVSYEFEFTNVGKTAVIITEAVASCGCTVPEYSQEPLAPGNKRMMTVKFNSDGKQGPNYKNVTIRSNANPGEQSIAIKAEVK